MSRELTRREVLMAAAAAGLGAALAPMAARAAEEQADPGMVAAMEKVKERLRAEVLAGTSPEEQAMEHLRSLRPDGTWADIDYAHGDVTNWRTVAHLNRILTMARAFRLPGAQRGSAELKRGIVAALDHWTARDYKNRNWWWNVIGVPMALTPVMLLMEKELSPEQMRAGLAILERAKLGMTGQNLVWVANLTIRRGCLAGDAAAVREAFNRVAGEVCITTKEGIQPDFSFHQHGAQLYSGGYGRGFSVDVPRVAALAEGTPFAFPEEKLAILAGYLLDGQQWMIRGRTFDYSAVGREISRRGHSAGGLGGAAETMARLYPPRRAELEAFARRMATPDPPPEQRLQGNRHFWRVDMMAHHRAAYTTSVRTASTRVQRTEFTNRENTSGHRLADGVNTLYLTGEEYRDIFPAWDWERLPGITAERGGKPIPPAHGTTPFVGGVSDGTYGLAACDFAAGPLKARKAWFFFDREYVCLGAGIACPTDNPVITSINQCHARGAVTLSDAAGTRALEGGAATLAGPAWVHHDGVAYLFPEAARVTVRRQEQKGSWRAINASGDDRPVALDVFSLWIEHGAQVANGSYAYVVVPGLPAEEAPAYARNLPIERLSNTPEAQAVRHPGLGITAAAFYAPGRVAPKDGPSIAADAPCLVLLREGKGEVRVAVSNPENKPLAVNVEVGRRLEGEGCTWIADRRVTRVAFQLPDGPDAGKSVVRTLRRS